MSQLPQIKKHGTLTQHAYEVIKTAIIESTLPPGMLLLEEDLCAQLGVSRTPVRAAMNQLIHEGLVDVMPGRGTFVSQLQESQFVDLFAVRKALEELSIRLCVERSEPARLEALERVVAWEKAYRPGRGKSKLDFLRSDIEFHLELARASGNLWLERQLEQILSNSCRFVFAYTSDDVLAVVADEHEKLCALLRDRKLEGARECLMRHLQDVENRVVEDLRQAARG